MIRTIFAACAVALAATTVSAQDRIVRLVIAFPPGGPVDFVARVISEPLAEKWGRLIRAKRISPEG